MKSFSNFVVDNDLILTEASISPALRDNVMIRRASKIMGKMDDDEAEQLIDAIYGEEIYPIAEKRLKMLDRLLTQLLKAAKYRKLRNKPKISTQIKKVESLKDKAVKRKKPLLNIGDIVRGAILFDDIDVMGDFVSDFQRKHGRIIDDYEFKVKGADPTFGYYGTHHFDLILDGMIVELQVSTKKLWAYKKAAHDIYTNLRSPQARKDSRRKYKDLPDSLKRVLGFSPDRDSETADRALSKRLFSVGNVPRGMREETENMLDGIDLYTLLSLSEDLNFQNEMEEDIEYIDVDITTHI